MKLRYFLLFASLLGLLAHDGKAQSATTPDCQLANNFTSTGNSASMQATTGAANGCATFRLTFWSTGFTGYTISLQGSQDNATFADITTTADILEGSNPTVWTSSSTDNSVVIRAYFPYYRVHVNSVTGTGSIHATLFGYKGTSADPTGSGGGGGGTVIIGGATSFGSGQQAVTGTAAALTSNASKNVCIKANIANTINVYVGATGVTTSTGFELPPGTGTCQYISNTNLMFVVASTTGATVTFNFTN